MIEVVSINILDWLSMNQSYITYNHFLDVHDIKSMMDLCSGNALNRCNVDFDKRRLKGSLDSFLR